MPFKIDDLMIDVLSEPRGRMRAGRGSAGLFVDTPPTPLTPITPVAANAATRAAEEVFARAEAAATMRRGGGGSAGMPGPDDDINDFPPWVTPRIRQLDLFDPQDLAELKAQLRASLVRVEELEARAAEHLAPKSIEEVEGLMERLRGAMSLLEARRAMMRGERTS